MEVSSNGGLSTSYNIPKDIKELDQSQRDELRILAVSKLEKNSKEAQIDAYVQGTKNASSDYENNDDYVQNYTDFAADVRRQSNYTTFLENGGDPSNLVDRPGANPLPEIEPEDLDAARQAAAGILGQKSTQDQIEAYKAGSSSSTSYDETAESVKIFNEFAADVRRSENINTYIQNDGNFLNF